MDGIYFASQLEARYYQNLKLLKKSGIVTNFALQKVFELQPAFKYHGIKFRRITYKADFEVRYADGHTEVIDTKGRKTTEYKIKKKLLLFKYPDIIFKEITEKEV